MFDALSRWLTPDATPDATNNAPTSSAVDDDVMICRDAATGKLVLVPHKNWEAAAPSPAEVSKARIEAAMAWKPKPKPPPAAAEEHHHHEPTEEELKYDNCAAPFMDKIKELFDKLDEDGSGDLDGDEMKEVVGLFQGSAFDEEEFMSWYDAHGESDGTIDLREFGWYLADCAECDPSKMEATIASFEETVDYVINHRK